MGTKEYILSRGAHGLLILYLMITVNFLLFRIMPGDPRMALLEPGMTPEMRAAIIAKFGLDKPLHEQYLIYIWNLFHGDWGESFRLPGSVLDILFSRRLTNTFILMGASIALSVVLGMFVGVISAWKFGTRTDTSSLVFFLVTYSIPIFWFGLLLLLAFGRYGFGVREPWSIFAFVIGCAVLLLFGAGYAARRYLASRSKGDAFFGIVLGFFFILVVYSIRNPWKIPIGGTVSVEEHESWLPYIRDYLIHMAAPLLALTLSFIGSFYLIMRDSVLDIFTEDYMLAAKAKGLSTRRILYKHATRNAMLPMISIVAVSMVYLVGGAIMTETVFSYPGIGLLTIESLRNSDYPILQGIFVLVSTVVVLSNFVADLLYLYLDPRIRYD
ncbi:MAG: ABC transporter permease [Candidatus Heimdallarchaeota archaeon]